MPDTIKRRRHNLSRDKLRTICSDLGLSTFGEPGQMVKHINVRNSTYYDYMKLNSSILSEWSTTCQALVSTIQCCPVCSFVDYGGTKSFQGIKSLSQDLQMILKQNYDSWIQYSVQQQWIYTSATRNCALQQVDLKLFLQTPESERSNLQVCKSCYKINKDTEKLAMKAKLPFSYGTVPCHDSCVPYSTLYFAMLSEEPFYRSYFSLLDVTYVVNQMTSGCTLRPKVHVFFEMPLFANKLQHTSIEEEAHMQRHDNVQAFHAIGLQQQRPPDSILSLYFINRTHNLLFHKYLPLLERKNCQGQALYTGPADSVMLTNILQPSKARDVSTAANVTKTQSTILADNEVLSVMCGRPHTADGIHSHEQIQVGSVQDREGLQERNITTTVHGGINTTNPSDDSWNIDHGTMEQLLFPHLFPQFTVNHVPNTCFNVGLSQFKKYLSFRCHQLFSPYSLTQEYICLMYQAMKTTEYSSTNTRVVIQQEYDRQQKACAKEGKKFVLQTCLDTIEKYKISKHIKGSPLWYKNQLHNIEAVAAKKGIPHLMMTLTVDDCSATRWKEYDLLDDILRQINPGLKAKSAPCETTLLFHNRFRNFFNHFILGLDGGCQLLGRVTNHVIKYELQGRQAWHTHVLLWIHPDDLPDVEKLLTMEIPYEVDPETGEYKVPSDELLAMLHNIIVQKNQHSCSSQCRLHGECRYGFPFPAQYSHTPVLCPKSKRYLPYCPGYRHRNTVCYVPMIALLWNAHTNVVRVTNDNLSYYLLKYTAKAEPAGSLMVEPDAMHSLTVPDCSEITRRILTDVVYSKPVSVSEAALNMLGIDVVSFSDQVVFINSCIPSQRTSAECVVTRRGKDAFTLDQISAYCDRPPHMESLTIVQFYEQYDVVPRKQSTRQEGTFVVMHNKQIVKRKKEAIVRLSRYAPGSEDPEGFFFNALLQTQTFRRENELLGRDSTYYGKCIEVGLSDTTIRLRHMLETHYMNMLASEFNLDKDCQFIYDHYENQTGVETHTPVYPCPTNHHSDDVPILTHDQQQAFDHIKQNPSGFHVIQGGPGCGKSFIINHIHQYFHSMNKNVVLCASTAIAAVNIHGHTIDRVVALERSGEKRTNINFRNKAYLYCKHADVIIVDEAFMLTASKLDICIKRILNCGDMVEEDQIAQKLFILVGDSNQLPPICQHKSRNDNQLMETCRVCNIMNSEFSKYTWHIHNLSTSCRFTSDPKWGEFILGIVSNNTPPSREQIKQLFSSRVLPQDQWLPFLIDNPDAISIHAKNDNALELGECLLVHKCQTAGIPVFDITPTFRILSGTPPHSDDLIAKVKESFTHDLPKIHCMRKIAIGTEIIFSKNQDFDKGLINGAVGSIVSVAYKNPNKPNRLKQTDYVTTPLHSQDMIPWALKVYVKATKQTVTLYAQEDVRYLSNGFKYATRRFPIMPASSFTAHKAQGKTIKTKVLLDIRDIFQEGQLFVMLSRVTTLHQIYLTELPTPDLFKVSPISQCDINQ